MNRSVNGDRRGWLWFGRQRIQAMYIQFGQPGKVLANYDPQVGWGKQDIIECDWGIGAMYSKLRTFTIVRI